MEEEINSKHKILVGIPMVVCILFLIGISVLPFIYHLFSLMFLSAVQLTEVFCLVICFFTKDYHFY